MSFADQLENRFISILDDWGWDLNMRSPGSLGDLDAVAARPLPEGGFEVHVAEIGSARGPKLSLTDASRHKWKQVSVLRDEYAVFEPYLWFRPKGVTTLRGLEEHEKFFGFPVSTIELDDSPLHYEDGLPMMEVLR